MGPHERFLSGVPPYVCNHQLCCRVRDDSPHSVYDWKEKLLDAIQKDNLQVRRNPLKVILEQSPQRKVEHGQYARAIEMLREEKDLSPRSWEPCGRTLRVYTAPGWQELGKTSAQGWVWDRSAFEQAQLRMPSFLAQPPLEDAEAAQAGQ